MGTMDWLRQQGLSNDSAPSISDIAEKRARYIGKCKGVMMLVVGVKEDGSPKRKTTRCFYDTLDKNIDVCPKCGHYIKWEVLQERVDRERPNGE